MAPALPSLAIEPNPQPMATAERAKLLADPGFGRVFTYLMAVIRYSVGKGWHDGKISAR
jgi:branched-chain amino acid aminotransferase